MSRATLKAIQAAAGNAGAGATYVDDVFSTDLWATGSNNENTNISNALDLGDFGYGTSTRFNGTSDYLSRSSDLTGNADGKTLTFSCWVFLPPMDSRSGNNNQRVLYATDSSDNGVLFNVDSSGYLGLEAWNGGVRTLQGTTTTKIGINVWTHILVSMDMSNSSNRYVYFNDVAASVTWSTYNNANIEFTRPTHYIGVWGNGTARHFYDDMAHFYLDYTYRNLSTESNRRIFIDANGGSTSASSLAALNPIMYLPMTTAYAVGKNAGTGGDFTANGSPTIVSKGTEYISGEGKGGLIWLKDRDTAGDSTLFDSVRGLQYGIYTTGTDAQWDTTSFGFTAPTFNADGYSTGTASVYTTAGTHVGWSFLKQPGFFDIVTYTGNGTAGRTVSHNLGSVPGFMVVKKLNSTSDWTTYHRSMGATKYAPLNDTDVYNTGTAIWNSTEPTATEFTVGDNTRVNNNGDTFVAYLFAHDAQDFGTDSDESIIKCGSYTGNGSTTSNDIDIGFEPQWVLIKNTTSNNQWYIFDVMRGIASEPGGDAYLLANSSGVEVSSENYIDILPNGFSLRDDNAAVNASSSTYIYVAIRRPHKPASEFAATDLFGMAAQAPAVSGSTGGWNAGFVTDMALKFEEALANHDINSRLTGTEVLYTDATNIGSASAISKWDYQEGFGTSSATYSPHKKALFRRAPGFFDIVAYAGNGTLGRTVPHNLGVTPELMIIKLRNATKDWYVYSSSEGAGKRLTLNDNSTPSNTGAFNSTAPTAASFTVGDGQESNGSGYNYIAYLFATVSGISKVGTYTGTGSNVDVDCGFSSGARFVLVKRTDSTGDWYVWNYLFGIVAGNDPYSLLNTSAAPVTNTDYIDPLSSGFTITSSAPAALNASGGSYIFYAIA